MLLLELADCGIKRVRNKTVERKKVRRASVVFRQRAQTLRKTCWNAK
jgi:hypothetical protein